MNINLKDYIIPAAVAGLMAAGLYGIQWAANLAWFAMLAISVLAFTYLLVPGEAIRKGHASSRAPGAWFFSAFTLIAAAAQGWFAIAFFYGLIWMLARVKSEVARATDSQQEEP